MARSHTHTFTTTRSGAEEFVELPGVELVVEEPAQPPRRFPLTLRPLTVGSGADCDVVAADSSVSRVHCVVRPTPAGVDLEDAGSKNGTRVRGLEVKSCRLPLGEVATLGRTTLRLEAVAAPQRLPVSAHSRFGEALGVSAAMRAVFELLGRAAVADAPVLLLGESGTGKELLARAIHDKSPRAARPFVVFDCGAVAPTLVEAELFGAVKGAFTGADAHRIGLLESAHQGTVFLDEIGELPLELQARLLRALEAREVRPVGANVYRAADARVVAATHRDLRGRVAAGTFREDLYFRLAVVVAEVPALRDRRDDIPLLVQHFLSRQSPPRGLDALPPNALELFQAHDWPGNVRELWNTVTRLVLYPQLGAGALEPKAAARLGKALDAVMHLPLKEAREVVVEEFEVAYLLHKLKSANDNVTAAAKAMGVSRQFLHRLLNRHGLRDGDSEAG
ncbi:MAG: sigma 54-dependent Fis family transcriptional regulator [Myxococcales bacterium]|nr:sigma 54-dependent Fis family transcriptional regulator [Myxococcales bacterium]